MKRKDNSMCGGRRKPVRWSEMRGQKEHQNKVQDESPHGSLPAIELQTQIRESKKAAEQRHGTIQIMVRNRVQSAGPLQKSKIVRNQAQPQEQRTQPAREFVSRAQA